MLRRYEIDADELILWPRPEYIPGDADTENQNLFSRGTDGRINFHPFAYGAEKSLIIIHVSYIRYFRNVQRITLESCVSQIEGHIHSHPLFGVQGQQNLKM